LQLPFPEPSPPNRELDQALIYDYLVGEIAAHRGDLATAQRHYKLAATQAGDAYAAERATRIALHLGDYESGLAAVSQWVELAPNEAGARQLAAVLLLRDGRPDAAAAHLDALVKIADAKGMDGFLQAASALSLEKDHDGAERLMLGLHERHAADVRSLYALAVLETAHRRLPVAEARLREVIARKRDWEEPRILLSRVLTAQERRDESIVSLGEAVEALPRSERLRSTYARTLVDAGRYAEALQQFRRLHELVPDDDDALFGYAMLATQQREWGEARGLWQKLRNDPERRDEASYYLGRVEEASGNSDTAIGLFRSVSRGDLRVDAAISAAQILARQGDLAEMRDLLRQTRVARPTRAVDLYVAETQLLQRYGDSAAALALYDDALAALPDSHDLRYNRALYLLSLGDFPFMEKELRMILEREPDHVDSLNALGYTLADRNERLDEARRMIERALELRPDSAAILDSMGWVLYRQGEFEQAERYLRQAFELDREDDEIAAHLGEVLWEMGRQDDAKRVWREALSHTPDSDKVQAVVDRLGARL
jgi:tetratricopeptide (TPR) repeat protein